MMKKFDYKKPILIVVIFLLAIAVFNVGNILEQGVATITQQEMEQLLSKSEVENCYISKFVGKSKEKWLSASEASIFKTSQVVWTHKYYFFAGGLIPNKYNHLIERKLAEGCK